MAKHASTKYSDLENPFTALSKIAKNKEDKAQPRLRLTRLMPLDIKSKIDSIVPTVGPVEVKEDEPEDAFEREMSRNMAMQGERKIKFEDISFESDTHNIYEPFYSSESDDNYTDTSDEV